MRKCIGIFLAVTLFTHLSFSGGACQGQTWIGNLIDNNTQSREWSTSGNWVGGVAPTPTTGATFDNTLAANTNVTFFGGGVASTINITNNALSHTFGRTTIGVDVVDPGAVTIGSSGIAASLSNASGNAQVFVSRVNFDTSSSSRTISNTASGGNLTFQSAVSAGNSSLAISNSGTGTVFFNGAVTASTITASGSGQIRFTGAVGSGVTSTGRVDGTGSIAGAVTLNNGAVYSPGAGTIGTQVLGSSVATNQNALIANTGSVFEFDLNSASSDVIDLSGRNLNLAADASGLTVRLNLLSAISPSPSLSWNIFTNVGNATSIDLSRLQVDSLLGNTSGLANLASQFSWSVTGANNNILTITAVPEPSSMALLGMAGLIGGVYARRRAKKNKA